MCPQSCLIVLIISRVPILNSILNFPVSRLSITFVQCGVKKLLWLRCARNKNCKALIVRGLASKWSCNPLSHILTSQECRILIDLSHTDQLALEWLPILDTFSIFGCDTPIGIGRLWSCKLIHQRINISNLHSFEASVRYKKMPAAPTPVVHASILCQCGLLFTFSPEDESVICVKCGKMPVSAGLFF